MFAPASQPLGLAYRLQIPEGQQHSRASGACSMSIYNQPFDPNRPLGPGCICGRHRSPEEHSYEARRTMMCEPVPAQSREKTYEGVVASAVLRQIFPKDAARRAFLKSVGASTALAALGQFFPLKTATE